VPDFDVNTPHIARIYDYWLGGKDNFEADRKEARYLFNLHTAAPWPPECHGTGSA
jgi:S-adenosyl methyltransferase